MPPKRTPHIDDANWHIYGPRADGSAYVHGPTPIDAETAGTLADIAGGAYITTLDHSPKPAEIKKLLGTK